MQCRRTPNETLSQIRNRKTNTHRKLEKHNLDAKIDLYDIVLCSNAYENYTKNTETDAEAIDNEIKNSRTGFTREVETKRPIPSCAQRPTG